VRLNTGGVAMTARKEFCLDGQSEPLMSLGPADYWLGPDASVRRRVSSIYRHAGESDCVSVDTARRSLLSNEV
jgi:hypothetical protein